MGASLLVHTSRCLDRMQEVLNLILLQGGIAKVTQLALAISYAVQAEVAMAKLRYQDRRSWAKLASNKTQAAQVVRRLARSALQEDTWKTHHGAKLGGCESDRGRRRLPLCGYDSQPSRTRSALVAAH